MLNQPLRGRPYLIKYMILSMALISGCAIGPAPKVDTGLINMKKRQIEYKNHKGTKFNISLDTKDKKNKEYLHNQICAPGEQVIDFMTWVRKAMTQLSNTYYNKR